MNAPTDAAAELKPCPFCGYHAKRAQQRSTKLQRNAGYGPQQFYVSCAADLACEAMVGGFPCRESADAAWNTRPPTDAAAVREAAAKICDDAADELDAGRTAAGKRINQIDQHVIYVLRHRAAAIRQLDLPGGEEVERLRAALESVPDRVINEVGRWLHRQGGFASYADQVASGTTGWSRLRSTIWLAVLHANRDAALTPARVERSGEGGGA